ncbi:MAG: nucleotidyl transferase AbiEii/AbiGii toxin family protein [Gammaproteobacteria bacterium]
MHEFEEYYYQQVRLLLRVLPFVAKQSCFALKGGTAINLFVREMPRLSVDIDLVYLEKKSREEAMLNIEKSLFLIKHDVEKYIPNVRVLIQEHRHHKTAIKLFIIANHVQIKIEVNDVVRGVLIPVEYKRLCSSAENLFGLSVLDMPVVSHEDLYAGKICAALDRQHPRDLFDVKLLLENEGVSTDLLSAIVVYIACGGRPIHELLNPNFLDLSKTYAKEFSGMTNMEITYHDLDTTRKTLVNLVKTKISRKDKEFLLSVNASQPDWEFMDFDLKNFPALSWKIKNIQKMSSEKYVKMQKNLEAVFG